VLALQIGRATSAKSKLPGWRSFHLAFVDVDVNIPATLTRPQPLPFGSPELLPPRGR
jgi:hypothetical protein